MGVIARCNIRVVSITRNNVLIRRYITLTAANPKQLHVPAAHTFSDSYGLINGSSVRPKHVAACDLLS